LSSRYRTILHSSAVCNESLTDSRICNTGCCRVDGRWSAWNMWSDCTVSCNSGLRSRTRLCNHPAPDCGGDSCVGNGEEVEPCNTQPCNETCEDGKVFNNCSNACDSTCSSLNCQNTCTEPDTCKPGCSCPPGLVENENKQCVKVDDCVCKIGNVVLLPGQTYEKNECESW
jgi:hypothetical protein